MIVSGQEREKLFDLLWSIGEENSSRDDVARLEQLAEIHPEAVSIYAQYAAMRGLLYWERNGAVAANLTREASSSAMGASTGDAGVSVGDLLAAPAGEPPRQIESDIPSVPLSPLTSPFSPSFVGGPVFSYMVATVVLGLMLLGAWAYTITHDQRGNYVHKNSRGLTAPGRSTQPPPDLLFVGRVTGMKDCRWSDPDTITYAGASVPLGRKYALSAGLMEITYSSGAKVILEGPCDYEVESAAGGFLALGKLTANVESRESRVESAKPQAANHQLSKSPHFQIPSPLSPLPSPLFTVRTPTAIVTDLGTEFGVEVDQQGLTRAHVFTGSVRLTMDAGGGVAIDETVLNAGQTGSVIRGNPTIKVADAEYADTDGNRFVRVMPGPKHVRDSKAYAKLVLSLQPAVYYRMEPPKAEKDRLVVFDSAPGGHHGQLRFIGEPDRPYRQGCFGRAVHLRGPTIRYWDDSRPPSVGDYALVPVYPDARSGQRSISAWIMVESRTQWAMIVCNSTATSEWYFDFGLHENDGDLSATSSRRYGERVIAREGASHPVPLLRWQHVAMVYDRSALRLYRNGIEVASTPSDESVPMPEVQALSIGSKAEQQGAEIIPYYCWQGRIDELAVFNRALTAAEVRLLADVANQPIGDKPAERRAAFDGR